MGMYRGISDRELLDRTKLFFVLGTGRSGTQWLSSLLDRDPGAAVLHEPDSIEDMHAMELALRDRAGAAQYIRSFRVHKIAERIRRQNVRSYGEVNGMLRYHARALAETLKNARLLLLCRDGREFVRSVMGLPFYVPGARGAFKLEPGPEDALFDEWPKLDRLAKICWMWADSYERLMRETRAEPTHFERILVDYAYFEKRVLGPTGLRIGRAVWEQSIPRPSRNATRSHRFPAWPDWQRKHRETFERICGPTMDRLGYVIDTATDRGSREPAQSLTTALPTSRCQRHPKRFGGSSGRRLPAPG